MLKTLSLADLTIALIPVVAVAVIYLRWLDDRWQVLYASARMGLQLLLVGYVLKSLFAQDIGIVTLAVIVLMIVVSSWIAMRPLKDVSRQTFAAALLSVAVGGSLNLALVLFAVIRPEPWHQPALIIPLAGMVYANCMNAVSIAAERFDCEQHNRSYTTARNLAFNAAMLPQINSLLAVGLVALPGMMTGQILSGVSPLIAVRYQIVVMCMILGSAGIGAALYLHLLRRFQLSSR